MCMKHTHNYTLSVKNRNHIGSTCHHRKLGSADAVPVSTYNTLVAVRVSETSTTDLLLRSALAMAHQPRQPLERHPVAHTSRRLGLLLVD
jgi:hypothetical protein